MLGRACRPKDGGRRIGSAVLRSADYLVSRSLMVSPSGEHCVRSKGCRLRQSKRPGQRPSFARQPKSPSRVASNLRPSHWSYARPQGLKTFLSFRRSRCAGTGCATAAIRLVPALASGTLPVPRLRLPDVAVKLEDVVRIVAILSCGPGVNDPTLSAPLASGAFSAA